MKKNNLLILIAILIVLFGVMVFIWQKKAQPKSYGQQFLNRQMVESKLLSLSDKIEPKIPEGWLNVSPPGGESLLFINPTDKTLLDGILPSYWITWRESKVAGEFQFFYGLRQADSRQIKLGEKFNLNIGGHAAYYWEEEYVRNQKSYHSLNAAIAANDEEYWTLQLEILGINWPKYQPIFFDLVKNFVIK